MPTSNGAITAERSEDQVEDVSHDPYKREGLEYQKPSKLPFSKRGIMDYAEKVAQHLDFQPGGAMKELIESFGGKIHYVDFSEWKKSADGSVIVHGKHDFDILVSDFTGPARDRFTLAHEFGHYVLHSREGEKPIIAPRFGSNRTEWEANWFAAAFLMPQQEFTSMVKNGAKDFDLSSHFLVSELAISVRKKDLGLET